MTTDPFSTTRHQIAASILSANFSRLGAEIEDVLSSGADFLHLDVMDGHFVPNISFGPPVLKWVRPTTKAFLDAHLMVTDPAKYAPPIVKIGAQNVTFQVETTPDPVAAAKQFRQLGGRVGITLNPATPVEHILPAIEFVDVVLIMSVVPGFGGQEFMSEMLPKAREVKRRLTPNQRMEMDGGLHKDTVRAAADAGVDWFVIGSAIFDHPDRRAAIAELRERIEG